MLTLLVALAVLLLGPRACALPIVGAPLAWAWGFAPSNRKARRAARSRR